MRGLYQEPIGVDFSTTLARGLRARLEGTAPEAMARITVLVATSRMARRLEAALARDGATLLPRIGLVSDVVPLLPLTAPLPEVTATPLALRLGITQLVAALLDQRPDLSPPSAAFDLAGSLQTLLAEMQEERLDADALDAIDPGPLSLHWQRSLEFLRIATRWQEADGATTAAEGQALALDLLLAGWAVEPPRDPIIIAGSTASRAPTRRLIDGVLALPQGAVILPGLDDHMPDAAWDALTAGAGPGLQDHPQYRHAALLRARGLTRAEVPRWDDTAPANPDRDRLISLALRPAPITDAWREEGPALPRIAAACAEVTLLTAPSPGVEAGAIAAGLRGALAEGRRAALITPDRTLSRQVAAELDRWGIRPDDSAGQPLNQSAPGRLLLHLAAAREGQLEAEPLAVILKHPLTRARADRVDHLARARAFELDTLRSGPVPFPGPDDAPMEDGAADSWAGWLRSLLDALAPPAAPASLAAHAIQHRALVEHVMGGALPDDPAGRAAQAVLDALARDCGARGGDAISAHDFTGILQTLLAAEEVRDPFSPHPDVMIWGALEARVRSADLVILGGLNDDIWPGQPTPDPWLNRTMRTACGLRLPDRVIGLSAHDFQQAAAGPAIWLSRAARTSEADTVPSRWLNRIEGLLSGIGAEGHVALEAMRARGDAWLATAARLDRPDHRHPTEPAPRPAPIPPAGVGLKRLSVTGVETLIRDPYAIYARHLLRLHPLDPLRQGPDARLRGSALHDAMEAFTRALPDGPLPEDGADRLREALATALEQTVPWPGTRRLWLGKFDRAAPALLEAEAKRRAQGRPLAIEATGRLMLSDPPVELIARADRIDARGDAVAIYDYKTGEPPSAKQQAAFAKQLFLEALMVTEGAFEDVPQRAVEDVRYLRIGARYEERAPKDFGPDLVANIRDELVALLCRYAEGQPYIARLAPEHLDYAGDYDQLSRFGEWSDTNRAVPIPVGAP